MKYPRYPIMPGERSRGQKMLYAIALSTPSASVLLKVALGGPLDQAAVKRITDKAMYELWGNPVAPIGV